MNKPIYNISTSGGEGSGVSALVAHKHGLNFRMIFADTLSEDADLYRYLHDIAAAVGKEIIWLKDGRTPWDVFEDRKFIGNTRTAHCSEELKTKPVRAWLDANAASDEPMVLGMDWSEQDRIDRAQAKWMPRPVVSLLNMFKVYRPTYAAWHAEYGIKRPSFYSHGFSHNNCGADGCVKMGLAGWATFLTVFPDRFAASEKRMDAAMAKIGATARPFLRHTIAGVTHYLTLTQFREGFKSGAIKVEPYDQGGCGCFTDSEPDLFADLAA